VIKHKRLFALPAVLLLSLIPLTSSADGADLQVQVTTQLSSSLVQSMPIARITLSQPVDIKQLPTLTISHSLQMKWIQISKLQFDAYAKSTVLPNASYALQVPTSFRCTANCTISSSFSKVIVSGVDILWEEQLLAELGYLPVGFVPAGASQPTTLVKTEVPTTTSTSQTSTTGVAQLTTTSTTVPVTTTTLRTTTTTLVMPHVSLQTSKPIVEKTPGTFTWLYPSLPQSLSNQWVPGVSNQILKGAVMSFQDVHGLATTGTTTIATWNALLQAAKKSQFSPRPYNYVDVALNLGKSAPQLLTLYISGVPSFRTLANSGISAAPSDPGTYPVYLRYATTTMSGTNPDGTKYHDTGIPWVSYYNGGEGLHGFIRPSYGSRQSLGCIELPFSSAGTIWPHTPLGTLVTVRV
jgi:peptidoglycan hydrolase-like protein with peptidoglycan-binding domain